MSFQMAFSGSSPNSLPFLVYVVLRFHAHQGSTLPNICSSLEGSTLSQVLPHLLVVSLRLCWSKWGKMVGNIQLWPWHPGNIIHHKTETQLEMFEYLPEMWSRAVSCIIIWMNFRNPAEKMDSGKVPQPVVSPRWKTLGGVWWCLLFPPSQLATRGNVKTQCGQWNSYKVSEGRSWGADG